MATESLSTRLDRLERGAAGVAGARARERESERRAWEERFDWREYRRLWAASSIQVPEWWVRHVEKLRDERANKA
jgi:hypothetical protein